jgi:uncharacterized protein involved in outer membrane biogenesis
MRLRTILLIGLGVVVVTVAGAVVVLSFMDFGKYKGRIVEEAEQATGRKLIIAGTLRLVLFPAPALHVKDVSFANADWGSRPEMAKLGELSARIEMMPLIFGGNIRIARLALKDVDVLLETDGKGRGNWEFGALASATPTKPPETTPKEAGAFALPSFDRVLLQNILVTYRDGRTRKTTTATLTELSTAGSLGGPMQVTAAATIQAMPVQVTATIGALSTLTTRGQPYPVQAEIGVAGATVTLNGSANEPLAGRGLDFNFVADGKDLAAVGALAGASLPAKPYHLAATLSGDADKTIALKGLQASLGASSFMGEASFALSGPRPKLVATLTAPLIDLTEFPKAKPSAKSADDDRVFSGDPLPLEGLRVADADVSLSIAALKTEKLTLQNLAAHVILDDRDLRVKPFGVDFAGSHIAGGTELSARRAPATLTLDLDGKQVDLGKILAQMSGDDLLEAKGDLAVAVRGAGDSVRAIMGSLDGKSSMVVGRGVIKSRYADLIGADLFREAFAWAQGKKDATLNCLVTRFDIEKGVATSRGMLMDTSDVSMLGEGTVNLGAERLDLELTPRPKETSLLNLAVPIDIGGTFKHPTVQPNKMAVAKRVAIGVASAINPLTAIGALVLDNTGGSDKNPCVAALDGGKGAGAKKEEGGIGGAVKDLGRQIEGIFK